MRRLALALAGLLVAGCAGLPGTPAYQVATACEALGRSLDVAAVYEREGRIDEATATRIDFIADTYGEPCSTPEGQASLAVDRELLERAALELATMLGGA